MDVKQRILDFIKYKGISIKRFEEICQLSNGYISSMRKGFGSDKLNNVLNSFPDLNRDWLLYGEGEMIKPIQSVGDISNSNVVGVNVSGKDVHVNPDAYNTLLKIVEVNQKTTLKFQEQIDRLLSIIESKYGTENR